MKRPLLIAAGITIILSLILTVPLMASTPTFSKTAPHYDINLVTELTDPTSEIKVPKSSEDVFIAFVFKDITTIEIKDSDGTDGYATVWVPKDYWYDFFAQARGKPGTSGTLAGKTLTAKSEWTSMFGGWVCEGGTMWAQYNNNGCPNFALRLIYSEY